MKYLVFAEKPTIFPRYKDIRKCFYRFLRQFDIDLTNRKKKFDGIINSHKKSGFDMVWIDSSFYINDMLASSDEEKFRMVMDVRWMQWLIDCAESKIQGASRKILPNVYEDVTFMKSVSYDKIHNLNCGSDIMAFINNF